MIAGAVETAGTVGVAGAVEVARIVEIAEVAGTVEVAGAVEIAGIEEIAGVGETENVGEETAGIVEIFAAEDVFAGARERLTGVESEDRFAEAIEEEGSAGVGGRGEGGRTLDVPREFLGKKGFAHGLSRRERG
jgi:hypothetical protein